jgi:hypothetical protein
MLTSKRLLSFLFLLGANLLSSAKIASAAPAANSVKSSDDLPFNIGPDTMDGDANYTAPIFPLLPFKKYESNPILSPNPANDFESTYLYNPW